MAKKNDAALSKSKSAGAMTSENTPRHKLLAMGQSVKTEVPGKKTPA